MTSEHSEEEKNALRFCDAGEESRRNLPPIKGFENMPLVSLEDAVKPLKQVVPEVEHMVWTAKAECHEPKNDLTCDELAAIKLYSMCWTTVENAFYVILNRTLRAESRGELKPWFLYLRLLLNALAKLPPCTQDRLFRGVKEDLRAQYPKDSTPIWWGFTSCTTDMSVLSNDLFLGQTGARTFFLIHCLSGKDIREHSFYPKEDEVLLTPGVQFRVISSLDMGSGLSMIELKEIQPPHRLLASIPSPYASPASIPGDVSAALLDNLRMVRIANALMNKLTVPRVADKSNDSSPDRHGSGRHTPTAPTNQSPKTDNRKSHSCVNCHQHISGSRYMRRDEHVYCVKCYEDRFANTCEECRQKIRIDAKDLTYKERHWHEQCFFCSICNTSLVNKPFGCKNEQLFCSECYRQTFSPRCHACQKILQGGAETMEYDGKQYHEHCFACSACAEPIGTRGFVTRDNKRFCVPCHEERFATKCTCCHKPITQSIITYKNQPWHRECFTCTSCKTPLANQPIVSRDEQPYCTDCSARLFAKRCVACSQPIAGASGTRYVTFEDRHWHNDCFVCRKCKRSLVGQGFKKDESNIICLDCGKRH